MTNVLKKINKAAIKFLQPLTPLETYKTIIQEAVRLVRAEFGSILLIKKDNLVREYSSDPRLFAIVPRKRGFTYRAYKSNKAYVVDIDNIAKIHPEVKMLGVKSTIFIPLSYKNKTIGVLSLDSLEYRHFTKKELQILELFGSLASLAIRKTQLLTKVKDALESRDLFMSLAAHEFRTPLTIIIATTQLLENKLAKKNLEEAKMVKQVLLESFRLTRLVNELLEISQIKTGGLRFFYTEQNIKKIIEKAIKNFKFTYPNRKIIFKDFIKNSYKIFCDFDKILQVISNLLDNAVKFSPIDSIIALILKFDAPDFVLSIKDTGIGISKKDLPYVFKSFYRGIKSRQEGMGLGLFLAKKIIEEHRGSIQIKSQQNQGTTVEIRLPKL